MISIAPPGYEFGLGESLAIINQLRWLPRGELDNPQIENNGNHDLGLSIWRVDMLKCFFVLWSKQTRNNLSEIWLLDVHSQYNCGPIIFSGPTDIEKQLCLWVLVHFMTKNYYSGRVGGWMAGGWTIWKYTQLSPNWAGAWTELGKKGTNPHRHNPLGNNPEKAKTKRYSSR